MDPSAARTASPARRLAGMPWQGVAGCTYLCVCCVVPAVLLAMEDVRAMLVKLCCRVQNMKTLSALPQDKQVSMAQETLEIFSVVANRLGIWSLKAELEDAAFAVLHPEEYESLKAQVGTVQT